MDLLHEFYLSQFKVLLEGFKFVIGLTLGSIKTNEFATFAPYSYLKCNAFLNFFVYVP